jgi:hypothetical protein
MAEFIHETLEPLQAIGSKLPGKSFQNQLAWANNPDDFDLGNFEVFLQFPLIDNLKSVTNLLRLGLRGA